MEQIIRTTLAEAHAARRNTEALMPLLALLEDSGEPSPIMMILETLSQLTVAVQVIDAKITALCVATASTQP